MTTVYQTVIWVDKNGRPVSTEIHTPTGSATAPTASSDGPKSVTNLANVANKRPAFSRPPQAPVSSAPAQVQPSSQASAKPSLSAAPSASSGNSGNTGNTGSQGSSNAAPGGMGVCYDMITSAGCKQSDTINSDFGLLRSKGYGIVRIYDIGCPVGDFVAAAANNGLKVMIGTNSINPGDLSKLIGFVNGNWGPVDTVYIGNELVNTQQASAQQVAAAVSAARGTLQAAGYSGNVVTVDTFNVMQNDPTICSTSDYCAANAHAFFDPNTAASNAGTFVMNAYKNVQSANSGKRTVITESGWPWQGQCNGQACPSTDNQRVAMQSVMSAFANNAGSLYVFQAYDASYKSPGNLGIEPYFGIYDTDHYSGW